MINLLYRNILSVINHTYMEKIKWNAYYYSFKSSCIKEQSCIFFFLEKLHLKIAKSATSKVITFSQGKVTLPKNSSLSISEAYHIYINPSKNTIEVTANEASGAFYAVQTLLSLTEKDRSDTSKEKGHRFPGMNITDAPRFEYRGLMLDVSRNFVQKATVLKLLDLMATYKVNKFHFHLTDDDAWRLEIPEFPELTKVHSTH